MAANLGGRSKKGIVDINITPFVDIVLVVLIIFMVTSTVVAAEQIPVDLPDAATGESNAPTSLALLIKDDGVLYLDGKQTTEPEIRQAIRSAKSNDPELVCLIGADSTIAHGDVVHLIDLVRQEGVARFALDVDPVALPTAAAEQ
ncbi:MAG: ExbD/TolR family protein [Myxococcota bacterium]